MRPRAGSFTYGGMTKWFSQEQVAELIEAAVAPLLAKIAALEAQVVGLQGENARLKKDSSTSSKPPSSDIVKPPPPGTGGKKKKRRRGGQPGHLRHTRPLFPPEQVDFTETYELRGLGPDWNPLDEFRVLQQVELVEKLFEVTEHRARCYRHQITGDVIAATWPQEVSKAGLVGTRMSALIGYQKGACRKFLKETNAVMQFCWARLIRDVKFLTTLPDAVTCRFGEKLLGKIKTLFRVWHRRDTLPKERWQREAADARQAILKAVRRAPPRSEAQNIAQRFRDHGPYYFTFLERPGVEPTNNSAERIFRPLVIDRKITQGTRGEAGRRWCERIWTALATCAQRGRRAFAYLCEAIAAYFRGQAGPSLLALPP